MLFYVVAAGWVVVTYTVYAVIRHYIEERRHAKQAAEWGAYPVHRFRSDFPLGLPNLTEAMQHDKAGTILDFFKEQYEGRHEDKTNSIKLLGVTSITTCEPKNVQAMLATQFNDFCLGSARRDNFFPLLGNGIFTADGKSWEHSRALLRPQFTRDQVSDLELEEVHVKNLMKALTATNGTKWTNEVNLQVLFFRLTLDSATEFLLGESVDSQINELPENSALRGKGDSSRDERNFAAAFDTSQSWLASRARTFGYHYLLDGLSFRRANKVCHRFIDTFVKEALARNPVASPEKLETGKKYVFIDALVQETRDPIELRSQVLNILLAGRDTTASLLGFTFYQLAHYPEVFNKLRQTVLAEFGPYSETSRITFSSMKNCSYLHQVINETLRLYPTVPLNGREATRDCTLPTGGGPNGDQKLYVRKGQIVGYSTFIMHRRKALWGEDANEFKPERWVGRKPGWEYVPFNGGPRICLGQQFALTEASYVIIRMLQRFDKIENLDPTPMTQFATLTTCPKMGVKVRLHEAEAA